MAIVLPHSFQDGVGNVASGVQVMDNFAAVVAALEGVTSAAAGTDLYQAGVIADADWHPGAVNIAGGTGILELTAFGGNAWLPGPVSGLVRTFAAAGVVGGLKPPVLPGPAGFVRVGVELTVAGAGATVSVVSGAEKASEAEALAIGASPAISAGKIRVLDVIVKNTAGNYSVVATRERRTYALGLQRSIVAGEDTRTNTAYGEMPVPDAVEVTLAESGLIQILFQATWKASTENEGEAALFIGANQLKVARDSQTAPVAESAFYFSSEVTKRFTNLSSSGLGLVSGVGKAADYTGDVTTGQVVGMWPASGGATLGTAIHPQEPLGACYVFAAPGTYRVTVQFKAASGSVTVKGRKLWARALA